MRVKLEQVRLKQERIKRNLASAAGRHAAYGVTIPGGTAAQGLEPSGGASQRKLGTFGATYRGPNASYNAIYKATYNAGCNLSLAHW